MGRSLIALGVLVASLLAIGSAGAVKLSPDWYLGRFEPSHPFTAVDYNHNGLVWFAYQQSASGNSGGGRGQNYIGDDSAITTPGDPWVLTSAEYGFAAKDANSDGLVLVRTLAECNNLDSQQWSACVISQVVQDNN